MVANVPARELPAALANLVEPGTVSIYLNRQWEIDWDMVIDRRPRILEHEPELPQYLVYPEVAWLLQHALHENVHFMIDTLWHTGARVSEMLALTPSSFYLDPARKDSYVSLQTLKTRQRGRPKKTTRKAAPPKRMVALRDTVYIERVQRYFETFGTGAKERIFPFTRQTANNRLKRVAQEIPALPFSPSVHTLRHSFAVNAVLQGAPVRILQRWMGHSNLASSEIYTKVLGTETGHFMEAIRYSDAQQIAQPGISETLSLASTQT